MIHSASLRRNYGEDAQLVARLRTTCDDGGYEERSILLATIHSNGLAELILKAVDAALVLRNDPNPATSGKE